MDDDTPLGAPAEGHAGPEHAWPGWGSASPDVARAWDQMVVGLRGFLDTVAQVRPDEATIHALAGELGIWSNRLKPHAVEDGDQLFGRLNEPGWGQTLAPPLFFERQEPDALYGHVTFSRYFMGVNGAVHGGVLSLMFDEFLGRVAAATRRGQRFRTASLKTNFRALTPLDTRLALRGWVERQEGRKCFVRGELRHGDVLCADAEALFVALRSEQA